MANESHTRDARVAEVAEVLGMNPQSIRIMAREGRFPNAYKGKGGGRTSPTMIPWKDVEDYKALLPKVCR
jgi:hypothetical protein